MRFVIITATALMVLAAGCSKQPDGEGVASAGGGVAAQQSGESIRPADNPAERVRQFVACMRENGVNVPDPEPGDTVGKSAMQFDDTGLDKAKVNAAMEKCIRYLPGGGENFIMTPEQIEATRRMAQCMRENGVPNFPDPLPDGSFDGDQMSQINKNDPAFLTARDKCREAGPGAGGKK